MKDANGKLLALLVTIPEEYRQQLSDAAQHIHACMPGDLVWDDSSKKNFTYRACHYSWYARYSEKVFQFKLFSTCLTISQGTDAPEGHPDHVRKDHNGRVNFEQRNAHRSKEMKNTEEYAILAEAYSDFFELLRIAVGVFPIYYHLFRFKISFDISAETLPAGRV